MYSIRGTITNVFYSLKDSKTPAKNATIGVIINVVLNLTLPFVMGVNGLALATSITSIYITSALVLLLIKKHNDLSLKYYLSNVKGIVLSSVIALSAMIACKIFLPITSSLFSVIIGVLVCAGSYLVMVTLCKVPIVVMVKNVLLNKVKK